MNSLKLNFIILLSFIFILSPAKNLKLFSQDTEIPDSLKSWKIDGYSSMTFNQTSLNNWVKGGESSVAGTGLFNMNLNYKKDKLNWENSIDLAYGLITSDQYPLRKTEDKIDLNSKLGYRAVENLYYTGIVNFKSQFADGFNFPNDSDLVSTFFAPAFLITSIGMDFKPSDNFSFYLSPITGRYIFVMNQGLADQGAFGVNPAEYDDNGNKIKDGQTLMADFGAYATIELRYELMENINLKSKLDLFNNYTDKNSNNRANIDVNFEAQLLMKVNKYISANVFIQLLYDHEQKIAEYERINGEKTLIGEVPKLQIKQILGIGITYNFKI